MPRASRSSRARSARLPRVDEPLGSLTQPGARPGGGCRSCGAERVTRIAMSLTDGTPVTFVSCHVCERRSWDSEGEFLDFEAVIAKTRKTA